VEAKLRNCCYCTICTCQICCNRCDHWRWPVRITCRKICHYS